MPRIPFIAASLLAVGASPSVLAQTDTERLRAEYEARLQALEQRPAAANAFNPAISLVLMGQYADYGNDAEFELPGFQVGGEAGRPEEGFSLDHTELTVSANIDPYWFGQVTAAIAQHEGESELELEEAFIENLALPGGLGLTFGRFLSGIGYINGQHRHVWDFVDAPLPQQAFLGGNYYDDGLRLTWLAPTPIFLELSAEALRGGRFPAAHEGSGIGAYTLAAHIGGDVGVSHSWQAGISRLWSDPEGRSGGGHAHGEEEEPGAEFSGDSDLTIVDAVWKWAPAGNARARSLVLQGEYYQRDEGGTLAHEHINEAGLPELETTRYDGTQRGFYAQAVYQFQPRWRAGLRYGRLWSDNRADDAELLEEAGLADAADALEQYSAMLDFATSEFSRLRLQYTRDETTGEPQNQWFLQYVMSLGAHGAHRF
jgi:hypothetical protein